MERRMNEDDTSYTNEKKKQKLGRKAEGEEAYGNVHMYKNKKRKKQEKDKSNGR